MNTPFPLRRARWLLTIAGLVLLAVGVPIFIDPLAYQAGMGVSLPAEATLLSDLRAMAGSLIGVGVLLLAAAAWRRFAPAAAMAGAVLYATYGLSRLVSMVVDGLPSMTLVGSTGIELLLGALLAGVALRAQ